MEYMNRIDAMDERIESILGSFELHILVGTYTSNIIIVSRFNVLFKSERGDTMNEDEALLKPPSIGHSPGADTYNDKLYII